MATPPQGPFRKRLIGYSTAAVDAEVARLRRELEVSRAEIAALEARPAVGPEVAAHLAALLQSFAETVAEGQREAEAQAARIVADAEERAAQLEAHALRLLDQANEMAAATEAEASARVDQADAARRDASDRIGDAVGRLSAALAALGELPTRLDAVVPPAAPPEGDPGAGAGPGPGAVEPLDAIAPGAAPADVEPLDAVAPAPAPGAAVPDDEGVAVGGGDAPDDVAGPPGGADDAEPAEEQDDLPAASIWAMLGRETGRRESDRPGPAHPFHAD
jgi:hypothetical protein